jgi:hypothetical protein
MPVDCWNVSVSHLLTFSMYFMNMYGHMQGFYSRQDCVKYLYTMTEWRLGICHPVTLLT